MDVTAIMEKTVKNTGGVAALQKMPKNYKNGCNCYHSRSASPPRTLTLFEAKSQLASPPSKKT
jgi:hypothetical protein